jgi:hypothetical protein
MEAHVRELGGNPKNPRLLSEYLFQRLIVLRNALKRNNSKILN